MKKLFFNAIFFSALTIIFIGCSAASKTEQIDTKEPNIEEPKEKIIIKEKIVYKEKKVPVYITKEPKQKDSKIILGNYEYVYIPSEKLKLKAKIDTGATTTSLHAINIKAFERDGKKWVKFTLENEKGELINKALPISRIVYIKRHGAKNQKRYVVQMRINVANSSQLVDVTLTDRSKFSYPVLIGKNFLTGMVLVDVSKKFTQEPIKKAK
ncbi:ATP-dependent zinc protease [Halarcobacter ebronensis]|uniref:ATP-dependent zinc protease family protein n=1 Tax=Halarcobacter ebronensis TaxID=1462615 RepID=UPI003C781F4A